MKIYFAHSMDEYDTEYEKECEEIIKSMFPKCEIVNPKNLVTKKGDTFHDEMRNTFFKAIDMSDIFIAAPIRTSNKYSTGVLYEIQHAKRNFMEIIELLHRE